MSDPRPIAPVSGDQVGRGPADHSADEVLNARLKAAGMYTIPQMMGVTPLTRWMVQVGMTDLDAFATWLDQRVRQFLRMKAGYELGDKDKGDELYEWVNAHSAAFSEARENFRAVREAMAAPDPDLSSLRAEIDTLRSLLDARTIALTRAEADRSEFATALAESERRAKEAEAENARLRTAVDGAIAWHAKRADVHDTHQMLEHDEQANRLRNAMDPNWRVALEEARGK